MKTILICGACGFIGRNLTLYYSKAHKVRAVYHKRKPYSCANVEWVQADLRLSDDVNRVMQGVDVVIQAAATTSGAKDIVASPHIHVTDNAIMNALLLRACYEHNIAHFIFFSCTIMYPSAKLPVREQDFNGDIIDKYFGAGHTKVYTEQMCAFYSKLGRTKHTVIRHSNIYGPYDKYDLHHSHVFGATISKILQAKDTITLWGAGLETRNFLYIDDLIAFVDAAIHKQQQPYGLYNCGSADAIAIKDLAALMVELSGKNLQITHDMSAPTIAFDLALNCEKALQDLGWQIRTPLKAGIIKTLNWWRTHIDAQTLQYKG